MPFTGKADLRYTYPFGLFAVPMHEVVRLHASSGTTGKPIVVMKDFGVTAICCTPSYFLHLLERAAELGVDIRALPLRAGVFGAGPWSESMRGHIQTAGGIQAYDT